MNRHDLGQYGHGNHRYLAKFGNEEATVRAENFIVARQLAINHFRIWPNALRERLAIIDLDAAGY